MNPKLAKERLMNLGCGVRPQMPNEWTGEFELPNQLLEFYQLVGPDNATIEAALGEPIFLPSLRRLDSHQTGYRSHPETGERFNDWPNEWIVVADANIDPFIYCRGEILFAEHGTGGWSPYPIFANIYEMAYALGNNWIGRSERRLRATRLFDDESNILPHRNIVTGRCRNYLQH